MTSTWVGRLGPFSLSVPVKSQVIVAIYVLFNVACFAIGVAFTLQHGALQALGIALVVGGLFSFGAFTAQWWDHVWQDQNNTMDRAFNSGYHDKRYEELQRLAKEWVDAYEKLEALAGPDSGDESPESHRSPASGPELDYQADAFMKGLIAQLGDLGDRQDGAARAQRDRIDEQSTERYDDQAAAKAELEPSPQTSPPLTTPPSSMNCPTRPACSPAPPPNCGTYLRRVSGARPLPRRTPLGHHHRPDPRHHRRPAHRPPHRPRHRRPRTYEPPVTAI
jgi:hypothetical protein